MSNLVNHANRFDADVTHVRMTFFRLRKLIAVIKRELVAHQRWLHPQNFLSHEDRKRHRRSMRRQRAIWLGLVFAFSLILLVKETFRALVSGAVWLLHYSSRLISARSPWLRESKRVLVVRMTGVRWANLAAMGPALAIPAITLITAVVVVSAKPATPVEVVLSILPNAQGPLTLTAAAQRKVLRERGETSDPSLSAAPGFTRFSLPPDNVPERLPAFGKDIASMMVLMTPLSPPKATPGTSKRAPTAFNEPRPLPNAGTARTISPTTVLAAARAGVKKEEPAALRSFTENPEPATEPLHRKQTNPTMGLQKQSFVPYTSW